jgi:hypothetical protein
MLQTMMQQRFRPQELDLERQKMEQAQQQAAQAHMLDPYRQQLMEAQTQKAGQDAAWTQMLMGGGMPQAAPGMPRMQQQQPQQPQQPPQDFRALQQAVESGQMFGQGIMDPAAAAAAPEPMPPAVTPPQEHDGVEILQPGNPGTAHLNQFAGFKGIPKKEVTIDSDGNMITTYPNGMITKQHVAASAAEKKRAEGLAAADTDVYKDVQKQAISSLGPQKTYASLGKVLSDPAWKEMVDSDAAQLGRTGRRLNLDYYRNFGTNKQKDMIGRVDSLSGKMVTQMANVFKGPFRVAEQGLIETIKPRPDDTLPAALAKLDELQQALDIETKVSRRMAQLMANDRLSAIDAFDKAKDELNAPEFVDGLQQKYGGQVEEASQQTITLRNKRTGQTEQVTIEEARRRGVPNV